MFEKTERVGVGGGKPSKGIFLITRISLTNVFFFTNYLDDCSDMAMLIQYCESNSK